MLLSVEFDPFLQDPGRICDCPVKTSTAGNNPLENVSSVGANRTQSTDHWEDSAEGDTKSVSEMCKGISYNTKIVIEKDMVWSEKSGTIA